MFGYSISGLMVASDLAMPGLIEIGAVPAAPDVRIVQGEVPDQLLDATQSGPNWQIGPGRFLLSIPDIVRILLIGGHTIQWQCEGDTAPADAAIFISGSGFGLLMHQHGRCVLHASAVAVGNAAVLFCGPSGAGKSTLAAALAGKGHSLLADDQCGLSGLGHGRIEVHPDGRALKLWEQAIRRLDLGAQAGAAVRSELRKFFVRPPLATSAPLPLAAIYVPQEARMPHLVSGDRIVIEPLNLADAGLAVRRNAYRPAMVGRMDQAGLYLQAAAVAMQASGVFRLVRPLEFAAMEAVVAALEAHWRDLNLLGDGD